MMQVLALLLSLAAICCAAPANLGISFEKRAGSMPLLKLPYATYQAAKYNANGDVCLSVHHHVVYISNLDCRSTRSRIFASLRPPWAIFDGLNQHLRRQRQQSKMALTGPFASKHLSKDLN